MNKSSDRTKNYDLFVMAAEPSADTIGADLLFKLKDKNLNIFGVLGPKMKGYGKTILPFDQFLVMGFLDVVLHLPRLIKNLFFIRKKILEKNPKIALFIDYPGFNLPLERSLRKRGFKGKIIHYICPSVWAWKRGRIKTMEKSLDILISTFSFEKTFLKDSSLRVELARSPFLDKTKNIQKDGEDKKNLIGIFPGSRKKEILRNLKIQLKALEKLKRKNLNVTISVADEKFKGDIKKLIKRYSSLNISLFPSFKNYSIMKKLSFAIATSGTITLELALLEVPTIVTYAIKKLDLFIAKHLLKINLPFYCIVNIIANEEIFKELYGPNLTEESLLHNIEDLLKNRFKIEKRTKKIRELLETEKSPESIILENLSAL